MLREDTKFAVKFILGALVATVCSPFCLLKLDQWLKYIGCETHKKCRFPIYNSNSSNQECEYVLYLLLKL